MYVATTNNFDVLLFIHFALDSLCVSFIRRVSRQGPGGVGVTGGGVEVKGRGVRIGLTLGPRTSPFEVRRVGPKVLEELCRKIKGSRDTG